MANLEHSLTGTCTMAIVMLVTFYPEELPGIPPSRTFSLMDVASYMDVWNAVRQVMDNCISRYLATNETMQEIGGNISFRSQTGWSAIGMFHILETLRFLTPEILCRKRKCYWCVLMGHKLNNKPEDPRSQLASWQRLTEQ